MSARWARRARHVRRVTWAALALFVSDCTNLLPPLGQAIVYVDTDAPLAVAPGAAPAFDEPSPLFDGLRVDILEAGGALA